MTILDANMDEKLDHIVKVWSDLQFFFNLPAAKLLLIDENNSISVPANEDNFLTDPGLNPDGGQYRFFDLSAAEKGDFQRILNILTQEAEGLDGVVFWNIDRIPRIADKTDLEYLVRFALKGDDLPNPALADEAIHFNGMKVLARCASLPQTVQIDGVLIVDTSITQ